jgi:CheY-like chemotaxis protein
MERQLIMVVDDDEAIRSALSDLLEGEGYRIVAVPDGEQALARLLQGPRPHAILLDLMMPGMDGWRFRAEQLVNPVLASIPVIIITALAAPQSWPDLGVATLTKPLDTRALLATVRKHCGHQYEDGPAPRPTLAMPDSE